MRQKTESRKLKAEVVSAFCLLLSALAAPGQGTLYTIFTNGPTTRRVNLVFLSEGYTTSQTNTFLTHATNAAANLLSQPPYQEYSNYFNAFAIWVASTDSGSSHPISGDLRNTYFNSAYDTNINYVISIPPNYRDSNYSHGQGKVDSLLATLRPETNRLAIMLVNDLNPGGAGYTNLTLACVNPSFPNTDIVPHETGHTFGGLADEYDYLNGPGFVPAEKPNATTQTNRALIKWTAWIDAGTPLPTPETAPYTSVVGLFEGANSTPTGWYRPKYDCKMKTLGVAFCEVCSEQLVRSIYSQLRGSGGGIDSVSPATNNFYIYSTQAVAFAVTPLQPRTHALSVAWQTNGVAVTGATNATFQLSPKLLGNGTHTLKAIVSDPTALVRTDTAGLLKATNSWTLTVSLNELSLISAQYLSGSRFRFTVTGAAPSGFVIQYSSNLVNWLPLSTNTLSGGKYDYTNSNLSTFPVRFYRTISPP